MGSVTTQSTQKMQVSELDFDAIKQNLKSYLQSRSEFTDYNFEGSGISVLLDILAYNTHYNAVYLNFVANEMFLDTATNRNNIVSLAKSLGYTPSSIKAARAYVDLAIQYVEGDPETVFVPKHTKFITTLGSSLYTFFTLADVDVVNFAVSNLEIVEGTPMQATYVMDGSDLSQKFMIPTNLADTSADLLSVIVQESFYNTNQQKYTKAESIAAISASSAVYWLQEHEDGKFEIVFGDGVFGKKPANGQVVIIDYVQTHGAVANGAQVFTAPEMTHTTVSMHTAGSISAGGSEAETAESIRFRAPRNFAAQSRIVTAQDAKTKLLEEFSFIQSVNVWGGEDETPPQYGKMFISIKPVTGLYLTSSFKNIVVDKIKTDFGVVSISPEIVNPAYTYIIPTIKIVFDSSLTAKSSVQIKSEVVATAIAYATNNLSLFDSKFRHSVLVGDMSATDQSILSCSVDIRIAQILEAQTTLGNYTLAFNNAFERSETSSVGTITSSGFLLDGSVCYFEDDPSAETLKIMTYSASGVKTYINTASGTVDYASGTVTVNAFKTDEATDVILSVKPLDLDLTPAMNQILVMETEDITATIIDEPSSR